ncbi:MAG: hypothetical protein J6Y44_03090, partial [Clostridia bacterium]|nr:hypothetical protein [Clostridia bacterium]
MGVRIVGLTLADDLFDENGEIVAKAGEVVSRAKAREIQDAGINEVYVIVEGKRHKIIANNSVFFEKVTGVRSKVFGLIETIHYPTLKCAETINEEIKRSGIEGTAEKYLSEINALYYTEEREVVDDKPEEKKNAEKRRVQRIRFVEACEEFFKILDTYPTTKIDAEQKKTVTPLLVKLNHKHISVDD